MTLMAAHREGISQSYAGLAGGQDINLSDQFI
jgi:hypothetical protein